MFQLLNQAYLFLSVSVIGRSHYHLYSSILRKAKETMRADRFLLTHLGRGFQKIDFHVGRFYHDYSGQVMVIFILTVAAAEAALALALVVFMHRQRDTLDPDVYGELAE